MCLFPKNIAVLSLLHFRCVATDNANTQATEVRVYVVWMVCVCVYIHSVALGCTLYNTYVPICHMCLYSIFRMCMDVVINVDCSALTSIHYVYTNTAVFHVWRASFFAAFYAYLFIRLRACVSVCKWICVYVNFYNVFVLMPHKIKHHFHLVLKFTKILRRAFLCSRCWFWYKNEQKLFSMISSFNYNDDNNSDNLASKQANERASKMCKKKGKVNKRDSERVSLFRSLSLEWWHSK